MTSRIGIPRFTFTEEERKTLLPEELMRHAMDNWRKAYAPYSNYRVGAAVRTADGWGFGGCNVECADYLGTHAEEGALHSMVMAGRRDPVLIAVVGALDSDDPDFAAAPPCGSCRQKLMEFAQFSGQDIRIAVPVDVGPSAGMLGYVRLSDLLPEAFGPAKIGVDLGRWR